jgi:DNA-binding CsgD family transcriptional regulator
LQIAAGCVEPTVNRHLSNVFDKLGVSSRRAAVTACACERRLL